MKTLKQLNNMASGIVTRNRGYKAAVHEFLVEMARYGEANNGAAGDVLARMFNSCEGVGSQQKIKKWIEDFTAWRMKQTETETGVKVTFKLSKADDAKWRVALGDANPWYKYSTEGDVKELEIDKLIARVKAIATSTEKAIDEGRAKLKEGESQAKLDRTLAKIRAFTVEETAD